MIAPKALLFSCDHSLIELVRAGLSPLWHLDLEVLGDLGASCRRACQQDVVLVLAHLPAETPDDGIIRLLWTVAQARRPCATLVLTDTAHSRAAALLRAGAADVLHLPAELPRLAHLADTLTQRHVPAQDLGGAAAGDSDEDGLGELLGQLRRVAAQDTTLLLTGETGTGKTRLARLAHELSPRRDQPFLVVDCGALSASLIESELFGHAKGAFTGADRERPGKLAAAGRGTLLLDEVNSLPLPLQAKLLRAVDERTFEAVGSDRSQPLRARLIAASNAPLEREVAARRFRADLFYRLNVVGFYLPPLRERREAVVPLAGRFLREFADRNRPDVVGLSAEAGRALAGYSWPGNVRELRNVLERAVALCPGPLVGLADLPEALRSGPVESFTRSVTVSSAGGAKGAPVTLSQSKEEAELRRIEEALHKHGNNRLRAAAELGISRMGLYKKLHKYGLMPSSFAE